MFFYDFAEFSLIFSEFNFAVGKKNREIYLFSF